MRTLIVGIMAAILLASCISPAYGGTRHGVFWQGANQTDWTTAEIQNQAQKLQGTGVNWVVLEVLWTWSEPNGSTPTPQGPQSYFGPTVQAWHNYNFVVLDQVVNEMRARNI
ncbi:MAG: hypothetical protein LAO21_18225 [Acidobacteriia bacterium]|nr:hypothetical protein [Terriglobia bacterium]